MANVVNCRQPSIITLHPFFAPARTNMSGLEKISLICAGNKTINGKDFKDQFWGLNPGPPAPKAGIIPLDPLD